MLVKAPIPLHSMKTGTAQRSRRAEISSRNSPRISNTLQERPGSGTGLAPTGHPARVKSRMDASSRLSWLPGVFLLHIFHLHKRRSAHVVHFRQTVAPDLLRRRITPPLPIQSIQHISTTVGTGLEALGGVLARIEATSEAVPNPSCSPRRSAQSTCRLREASRNTNPWTEDEVVT